LPLALGPNHPEHAPQYVGGGGIGRFRGPGQPAAGPSEGRIPPEDWIASTTTRFEHDSAGLSTLPDGSYLRTAIEADPDGYLGPEHVAAFGSNPGLLVKLIDSANRIGVHLHPDDEFARRHLQCDYGKTEAWVVLATEGDGVGWVGFTREVGEAELARWRAERAVDEMLAALHQIPLQEGSAVLVPAGVPHALGAGVLILELQQPSDFSISLEPRTPGGGDLGLGSELALSATDRSAWSEARLQQLLGPGTSTPGPILPAPADPFFRSELVSGISGGELEPGFAVLIGVAGSGELAGEFPSRPIPLRRGSTVLVPFAVGPTRITGNVEVVVCRPADPAVQRPPRPIV
jgi:mannose-6-phosphate isomerase